MQTNWSEARVRAMLTENKFTYQNIELPYGLETGGRDRSRTADLIFPEDMTGKTIFDVGCNYGYFCFEAEKRGAKHFVGAEVDPENLRKCRMLADCRGSKGEFIRFDIEEDPLPGQFDYVLCLNLLHHLRNPLSALEKLMAATRENLILEVASFGPRDRRKNGVPFVLGRFLNRLPLMYLAAEGAKKRSATQTFFITPGAVEALLVRHRQTFSRADILRLGHKGRFIAIARKRRIGHLFVVAGVPAGGKSTLIKKLTGNAIPSVAEELGFDHTRRWHVQPYGHMRRAEEPHVSDMLVHYNITQYMFDGSLHRYNRGLLDLIKVAERVTIATVWCPPDRALEQFRNSRLAHLEGPFRSRRKRKKVRRLFELYGNAELLHARFQDWFRFVKQNVGDAYVVRYDDEYRVTTQEEWEREAPADRS